MEEIACIVLVSDFSLQLGQFVVELITLRILGSHLGLQLLDFCIAVILQPLLVFLQLDELIVKHLDLFLLSGEHVLMISFKSEVVHLGVALVTHPIHSVIVTS